MIRRQVRVAQSFFDRLDDLLPPDRTGTGTPSATDFLLHEVPTIVDLLAEDFVGATLPVEDAPPVRVLVTAGILVPFVGRHRVAGTHTRPVEVIYLDVDDAAAPPDR